MRATSRCTRSATDPPVRQMAGTAPCAWAALMVSTSAWATAVASSPGVSKTRVEAAMAVLRVEELDQVGDRLRRVQVQPEHRTAVCGQHRTITDRLRDVELLERERAPRNGQILRRLGRDLKVDARRRSALVVLTGRVQEPRTPAERDRSSGTPRERIADGLHRHVARAIQVGLDGQITVSLVHLA